MRLLFLGDSLIEYCDWQARFPAHEVGNAGMAGETVAGLLASLPAVFRRCPNPEMVFLMIGTNNLLMEDYFFLPDYGNILAALAGQAPEAQIVCTSLLPMQIPWLAETAISRLNTAIHSLAQAKGASFHDLYAAFAESTDLSACFEEDGVHLSELGYSVWADEIAGLLSETR